MSGASDNPATEISTVQTASKLELPEIPTSELVVASGKGDEAPQYDARAQLGDAFIDWILPSLTACINFLDAEGNVLLVCNGGLSGSTEDQLRALPGDQWQSIWQGPSRDAAREAVATALSGGIGLFEGNAATSGGQSGRWGVVVRRIDSVVEGPGRMICVCRNITAQRNAEAQAGEKAALLEMTLGHMDQGLVLVDETRRIRLCNDRAIELLGLPSDTATIRPLFQDVRDHQVATDEFARVAPETMELILTTDYATTPLRYERERPNGVVVEIRSVPLPTGAALRTITDMTARRHAERELQASEARYRALVEASSSMVWRADSNGQGFGTVTSGRFADYGSEIFDGNNWAELIHPDDLDSSIQAWQTAISTQTPLDSIERKRATDGSFRWVHVRAFPLRDTSGEIREWVGATTDIHDRKVAEEALRENEERLRLAIEATGLGIWDFNRITHERQWSTEMRAILGLAADEPISRNVLFDVVHPLDRAAVEHHFGVTFHNAVEGRHDLEFRIIRKSDGELRWITTSGRIFKGGTGSATRTVGTMQDVTERKRAEEQLWQAANHDALTGLPNRAYFQRKIDEATMRCAEGGETVSLLLIDIDDFKEVNDMVGHDAGDAVLRMAAERLRLFIRDEDMVARLGGDEFAAILGAPLREDDALLLADRMLSELRKPFVYKDTTLTCKASIGLASSPANGAVAELITSADIALYEAKKLGRGRVASYSPSMRRSIETRIRIARDIRCALDACQIIPFYQPKICLQTGNLIGFEALARWRHPSQGILPPAAFASAFENPELAVGIGEAMLAQVTSDLRNWLDRGLPCGRIAINLSTAEFSRPDLAETILDRLALLGIATRHFEVEVTENVFLGKDACEVAGILQRFHERGITVALDDFGTGYASLTHLKQFPVDEIKIDRSFIRDLQRDPGDAAIVSAVIGLGKSLGKSIIAEGVESAWQVDYLRRLGCDCAQGYHFSKPMVGSRVPWFIENPRFEARLGRWAM
jgi:diguanylate cyclase (GGDEF)-like protein/PAS domain S-box-containing protein